MPLIIPLIIPWGTNYSNYSFDYSQLFPFVSSTSLPVLIGFWCTFYVLNCPSLSRWCPSTEIKNNVNSFPIVPMFRLWPGSEDSIKLIIPLIIPNYSQYSYYAHNPSRSIGHSLGNQLPHKRAIACRDPEDHCPLLFRIGQQIPGW